MQRITLDTNVLGAALKDGSAFRARLASGCYQAFVAETTLTLDGLQKSGKLDLLALKGVTHAASRSRWDRFVQLGVRFLLCPRIGLPRPILGLADGKTDEYPLFHRAQEHTYTQHQRQDRYFSVLRFIEDDLHAGQRWLRDLEHEIVSAGGTYDANRPWFANLTMSLGVLGENAALKRFGDWADADAIAAHYGYGNDIFCTNDLAAGAGARSTLSAENRRSLNQRYGIVFKTLEEVG